MCVAVGGVQGTPRVVIETSERVSEEQTSEGEPKQAGSEKEACPLKSEVERGRSEGKIERVDRKTPTRG
jgi:hypothetical protein